MRVPIVPRGAAVDAEAAADDAADDAQAHEDSCERLVLEPQPVGFDATEDTGQGTEDREDGEVGPPHEDEDDEWDADARRDPQGRCAVSAWGWDAEEVAGIGLHSSRVPPGLKCWSLRYGSCWVPAVLGLSGAECYWC